MKRSSSNTRGGSSRGRYLAEPICSSSLRLSAPWPACAVPPVSGSGAEDFVWRGGRGDFGFAARVATEDFLGSAGAGEEVAARDRRRARGVGVAVDAPVVPRPEAALAPALTEPGGPLACLAMTEV